MKKSCKPLIPRVSARDEASKKRHFCTVNSLKVSIFKAFGVFNKTAFLHSENLLKAVASLEISTVASVFCLR